MEVVKLFYNFRFITRASTIPIASFERGIISITKTLFHHQGQHYTHCKLKRASDDIILIGNNLLEAKDKLPKGQFIPWVKSELGISQPTAWRFMQVAKGKPVKSFNMNEIVMLPPVEPKESSGRVGNSPSIEERRSTVKKFFEDFPHLRALSVSSPGPALYPLQGSNTLHCKYLQ